MSLDAEISRLTKLGNVTIYGNPKYGIQVIVKGFEGENCSCRDVAVLACAWAIEVLAREMRADIERPGGNMSVGID